MKKYQRPARGILLYLVVALIMVTQPGLQSLANAQGHTVEIFGPITIERTTGKPLTAQYSVMLPTSIVGPYTVLVENGPNGAPRVSSASIEINGVQVIRPSELNQRVSHIEKEVNLEPVNSLHVDIGLQSKPGSRLAITLLGIDTTPDEVVLAEERGAVGSGGGVVSLPDIGEIELVEDATRPVVNIAVQELQAPFAQHLFLNVIPPGMSLRYAATVFAVESDSLLTTDTAIRVVVPPTFAASVPSGQVVELFAIADNGEGLSYYALQAAYDPITGLATATLPTWAWRTLEQPTATAANIAGLKAANMAVRNVSWVLLGTTSQANPRQTRMSARFLSVPGDGAVMTVAGNERLTLVAQASFLGQGTLNYPFAAAPTTTPTQGFSGSHQAIDWGINSLTQLTAAHSGTATFDYHTYSYGCVRGSNKGYEPGTGTPLTSYGFEGTVVQYEATGKFLQQTLYAHMQPNTNAVSSGTSVSAGGSFAQSDNTGCTSGPHLHFEYFIGPLLRDDPMHHFVNSSSPLPEQYRLGLRLNGIPVRESEVQMRTGGLNYDLHLDLTRYSLRSGERYPLELVIITPSGVRYTFDWLILNIDLLPLRTTLVWDKYDTDVDTHIYDSHGNHAWYGNLCGIPNGCLDRDDVDGFGPEIFTLNSAPPGEQYRVELHYYSDHGNGPTTARIIVEVNGNVVADQSHTLTNRETVYIGTYTPNP